jgi:hypothetical protein
MTRNQIENAVLTEDTRITCVENVDYVAIDDVVRVIEALLERETRARRDDGD